MNFSLTETLKSIELPNNQYSSLAQSVEHLTVNQGVVGSSPTGGAKLTKSETKAYRRWFRISFAFRRLAMIRHCVWHLARSPPICPFDIDANT